MQREWKRWALALAGAVALGWTMRWYLAHRNVLPALQPTTPCMPTARAGTSAEVPALEVTLNSGPPLVEYATLQRLSSNTFTIRNVTSVPIDVSAVSLFENVNHVDRLSTTLPSSCQYLSLRTNGCLAAGGPKTLGSGESCSVELAVDKDPLSGYLLIETSAGNLKAMISVL